MRSFVVLVLFAASLAQAALRDYEETRELQLSAQGIDSLAIDAGAGSMDINGVENSDAITVVATIGVQNATEEKAVRLMEQRMQLALTKSGNVAELTALFEDGFLGFGADAYIALDIEVPTGLSVRIDDGSGSIDIIGLDADISIDDGAGSIEIVSAADVDIDDGAGSIAIEDAAGDVSIIDGSGSITVRDVDGGVRIDDGSGSINVRDVAKDLIIVNDGSGGLHYRDVQGVVETDS